MRQLPHPEFQYCGFWSQYRLLAAKEMLTSQFTRLIIVCIIFAEFNFSHGCLFLNGSHLSEPPSECRCHQLCLSSSLCCLCPGLKPWYRPTFAALGSSPTYQTCGIDSQLWRTCGAVLGNACKVNSATHSTSLHNPTLASIIAKRIWTRQMTVGHSYHPGQQLRIMKGYVTHQFVNKLMARSWYNNWKHMIISLAME